MNLEQYIQYVVGSIFNTTSGKKEKVVKFEVGIDPSGSISNSATNKVTFEVIISRHKK